MSQNLTRKEIAEIERSIRRLDSFRTLCLLGEGPESITVDGHVFKDELEAEGYLVELSYALKDDAEIPGSFVSGNLEMPPAPHGVVTSLETFESAVAGLKRRELTCVLKARGQTEGRVWELYGDRAQVMAYAKLCKRSGFSFATDAKGLS